MSALPSCEAAPATGSGRSALEDPFDAIPRRAELHFTQRFPRERLDAWRRRGDPLADAAIEALARDQGLADYGDLLGEVRRRAAAGGAIYRDYLQQSQRLPDGVDFGAMRRGLEVLLAFPLHTGLALFTGSLVGGAVFQKMALVTAMTGMLSGDASRRLHETAAMVLRMGFAGALEPGGEAHELLLRVRLLHAAIRHYLRASGRFVHADEVPVNQHDLAITLALFGYLNLRSLARMGIRLDAAERESYLAVWRYAGHVIGIDETLLPATLDEQREFFFASLAHQARPEKIHPDTRKLMDELARSAGAGPLGPSESSMQRFFYQSCRHLAGDEYLSGMRLPSGPPSRLFRVFCALGSLSHFLWRRVPGGRSLLVAHGALLYRRALREIARARDAAGEYRLRTTAQAVVETPRTQQA